MQDPLEMGLTSLCQNEGALDVRIVGNYPLNNNQRMIAVKAQWDKASFLNPGAIRVYISGYTENLDMHFTEYPFGSPIPEEDLPEIAEALKDRQP